MARAYEILLMKLGEGFEYAPSPKFRGFLSHLAHVLTPPPDVGYDLQVGEV